MILADFLEFIIHTDFILNWLLFIFFKSLIYTFFQILRFVYWLIILFHFWWIINSKHVHFKNCFIASEKRQMQKGNSFIFSNRFNSYYVLFINFILRRPVPRILSPSADIINIIRVFCPNDAPTIPLLFLRLS